MPYVTSLERLGLKRGWKEGWAEGWKKGWAEGRTEGRRDAILRQLTKRFGDLPDELVKSIQRLPSKSQSEFILDLLDFRSLDDVRHWLQR